MQYKLDHNRIWNKNILRVDDDGHKSAYNGSETIVGPSNVDENRNYIAVADKMLGKFLFPRSDIPKEHRHQPDIRVDTDNGRITNTALPDIDGQRIDQKDINSYSFLGFYSDTQRLSKQLKSSDESGILLQVTIDPSSRYMGIKDGHGNTAKVGLDYHSNEIREVTEEFVATRVKGVQDEFFAARVQALPDEDLLRLLKDGEIDIASSEAQPVDWPQLKLPLRILDTGQLKLGSGYEAHAVKLHAHIAKAYDEHFVKKLFDATSPLRGSAEHDERILELAEIYRHLPKKDDVRSDKRFEEFQDLSSTMSKKNFHAMEKLLSEEAIARKKPLVYNPKPTLAASKTQGMGSGSRSVTSAGIATSLLTKEQDRGSRK